MPSPFPGMNPYLERADQWQDFHTRFITAVAEMLGPQVRANYLVRVEDHVPIHELPEDRREPLGRPDVAVARRPDAGGPVVAPVLDVGDEIELMMSHDEFLQHHVEIRDRRNREVVTVIKLLSTSNKKPGDVRDQYLNKRRQTLLSGTNLVEIDLLRGGPRLPLGDDKPPPACDYYAFIYRTHQQPKARLVRIGLRERLPTIPVPLRPEDGDARIDLQAIVNRVYDTGTYEAEIYGAPPDPPLSQEDAAWATAFLPQLPG